MRADMFVYISGPMTAKHGRTIEENVADGVGVYLRLLGAGIPAFSPHLSGAFPSAWQVVPYESWLAYDFAVLNRCTHVLMMERWKASEGAIREHEYAQQRGLTIFYDEAQLIALAQ